MKSLISISDDYLDGKSIQTRIKRILNIVFNCFITSIVYIELYGTYEWYEYHDYKRILNFILDGKFIIPLALFYLIDQFIFYLSLIIQLLVKTTLQKKCSDWLFEKISKFNEDENNSIFLRIHKIITDKISTREKEILINNRKKIEKIVRFQFEFNIKTSLTLILFFCLNPSFGWRLFSILIITQLANTTLTILVSLIFDIIPRLDSELLLLKENSDN